MSWVLLFHKLVLPFQSIYEATECMWLVYDSVSLFNEVDSTYWRPFVLFLIRWFRDLNCLPRVFQRTMTMFDIHYYEQQFDTCCEYGVIGFENWILTLVFAIYVGYKVVTSAFSHATSAIPPGSMPFVVFNWVTLGHYTKDILRYMNIKKVFFCHAPTSITYLLHNYWSLEITDEIIAWNQNIDLFLMLKWIIVLIPILIKSHRIKDVLFYFE